MSTDLSLRAHLYEDTLPGGGHLSFVLKRGQILRLTDITGGANVAMLLFNADQRYERMNLPDSLKAQHTAKLSEGRCIFSDMGRVLAAVIKDTVGWHDCFCGVLNARETTEKYGEGRYQELRNAFHRNGFDNFLIELGKWGMNIEDVLMNVNLFSKVTVDETGALTFCTDNAKAGDFIELYAPMNTLVVLTAVPHPLDPNPTYAPKAVKLDWFKAMSDAEAMNCRTSRPECARAFHNTERLFIG